VARLPVNAREAQSFQMSFLVVLWLVCVTLGCDQEAIPLAQPNTAPLPASDSARSVSVEPPSDARLLCSGHVTGSPLSDGSSARHIAWRAFTSHQDAATLTAFYAKALGVPSQSANSPCRTWRLPPSDPRATVQVWPVGSEGPWNGYGSIPNGAKSIVLVSTSAGPKY
jgi:hypothetical protein